MLQEQICPGCGRPETKLKPFGKSGDPIKGNHEGKKLVCRERFFYERHDHESYEISKEIIFYEGGKNNMDLMIAKYGEEKAMSAFMYIQLKGNTRKSWECRDCIVKIRLPFPKSDIKTLPKKKSLLDEELKLRNYEN